MVKSFAMDMVPDVGVYSPTIIFNKVVLPVPFAPIRPIFSPGFMCQFASSYNALAPISNVRLFIAIICAQRYDFWLEIRGWRLEIRYWLGYGKRVSSERLLQSIENNGTGCHLGSRCGILYARGILNYLNS